MNKADGYDGLGWLIDSLSPPGEGPQVVPSEEYCTLVIVHDHVGPVMLEPPGGFETEADNSALVWLPTHTGLGDGAPALAFTVRGFV